MLPERMGSDSMLKCIKTGKEGSERQFPIDRSHQLAIVKEKIRTISKSNADYNVRGVSITASVMLFAFAFEKKDVESFPNGMNPRAPLGSHPWLPLFLRSAGMSGVNYTIIGTRPTYDAAFGLIPPNVRFIQSTYAEFVEKASQFLFNEPAPKPLVVKALHTKAEDFKPMLGAMYEQELGEFDWWGHVDVDMMVGDIRKFLPAETLLRYDIITPLPANPWNPVQSWAPFTMYRNRRDVVRLYEALNSATLKTLLFNPEVMGFAGASGGAGGHWGNSAPNKAHLSMSTLIQDNTAKLKLRVFADGLPYGSDWKCVDEKTGLVGNTRCNECVFATNAAGTAATVLHAVGYDGYDDALLCNFRFGRAGVAQKMFMLKHKGADLVAQSNLIFQSFPEGFRAHVESSTLRLQKLEEYKNKSVSWESLAILEIAPVKGITNADLMNNSVLPVKRRVKDDDVFQRMYREEIALNDAGHQKRQLHKLKRYRKKTGLASSSDDVFENPDNAAAAAATADDDDAYRVNTPNAADNFDDDDGGGGGGGGGGEGESGGEGSGMMPTVKPRMRVFTPPPRSTPKVRLFTLLFGDDAARNPWLNLFLRSASHSGFNITIVGSPRVRFDLPENVDQIEITLLELIKKTSKMVFDGDPLIELEGNMTPYKVIDFKPLLGFLFEKELAGYDWWGHIDNDLLLGNLRRFLDTDVLHQYDVLTPLSGVPGHPFRTWGPFTMFRNTAKVNTLFRLAGKTNLRKLFTIPSGMWFDEWSQGDHDTFDPKFKLINASMTHIINANRERLGLRLADPHSTALPFAWDSNCQLTDSYKGHCGQCRLRNDKAGRQELAGWKSGKWKEMVLCHFQMGKGAINTMLSAFQSKDWKNVSNSNELLVGGFTAGGIQARNWDEVNEPLPWSRSGKLRKFTVVHTSVHSSDRSHATKKTEDTQAAMTEWMKKTAEATKGAPKHVQEHADVIARLDKLKKLKRYAY